jgi:hypothetical protein
MNARHCWGEPMRFRFKTERTCLSCGLVKVTRRDAGDCAIPWVEFWRDGVRVEAKGTPACDPARGRAR